MHSLFVPKDLVHILCRGEGAVGHLIVLSVSLDTGGSLVNGFEELLAIRDESQTHRLVSSPLPGS